MYKVDLNMLEFHWACWKAQGYLNSKFKGI